MNKIIDGVVYLDLSFYSPEVLSKIKKKLDENKIPNSYCIGGIAFQKFILGIDQAIKSYANEYLIFNLNKDCVKSNSTQIKFNHNIKISHNPEELDILRFTEKPSSCEQINPKMLSQIGEQFFKDCKEQVETSFKMENN